MKDFEKLSLAAYRSALRVARRRDQSAEEWHAVIAHLAARIRIGKGASVATSIKRAGSYIPQIEESMQADMPSPAQAYVALNIKDKRFDVPVDFRPDSPPALTDDIRIMIECSVEKKWPGY